MNLETVRVFIMTRGVDIVINIAAAIALWIIGRWLIGVVTGGMHQILARGGRVDPTLAHYLGSILGALLNLFLILAITTPISQRPMIHSALMTISTPRVMMKTRTVSRFIFSLERADRKTCGCLVGYRREAARLQET